VAGVGAAPAVFLSREAPAVTRVVELHRSVRAICFLFFALCILVGVLATGTITAVASFVSLYAA
jgi:hypothetical protein